MVAALGLLWERGHSGVALIGGCDLRLGIRGKHGSRMSHGELVSIIRVRNYGGVRSRWWQRGWERWPDSEPVLMVGLLGFPVVWTEKEKVKVLGLSN